MARLHLRRDDTVSFPAFFVTSPSKTEKREFVAEHAFLYLSTQHRRGVRGAVMIDIDDTLIDRNEKLLHGFQQMKDMYDRISMLFPVHIVTARPDSDHDQAMRMLRGQGIVISPDRLHMLPARLYDRSTRHVEEFKWECYKRMNKEHHGVVARLGDRLWDVAELASLDSSLRHVKDTDCYIFMDPVMRGTYSAKLPGT